MTFRRLILEFGDTCVYVQIQNDGNRQFDIDALYFHFYGDQLFLEECRRIPQQKVHSMVW